MRKFKKVIPGILSVLLCAVMAFGATSVYAEGETAPADGEKSVSSELAPPEQKFMRQVSPYAAAAALALADQDSFEYLHTAEGMWDAIGWYTVYRGYDYITLYEVRGVQEAIWPGGTFFPAPEDMIENGTLIAKNRGGNIGMSYEFPAHRMLYDNDDLDVGYHADVEYSAKYTVNVTVTLHFGDRYVVSKNFTIYVKPWNLKASIVLKVYRAAYTIRSADIPKPVLSFTADDLHEANNVRDISAKYGTLKVSNRNLYDSGYSDTYYYAQDGAPAYMTVEKESETGDTAVYGYYKGFNYYTENGQTTAFSSLEDPSGFDNDIYTEWFMSEPIFLESDGNMITFACLYSGFYGVDYDIYTVDKNTLFVQDHSWVSYLAVYEQDDDGYYIWPDDPSEIEYERYYGSTEYTYGARVDDSRVTKAWTEGVRTVTVNIENFEDGKPVVKIYKIRVPKTWEYIPEEFFIYNCWMNEGYTREYEYPGDGVSYTLYLTSAVG